MYLIFYKTIDGQRTWIYAEDENALDYGLKKIASDPTTDKDEIYYIDRKGYEQY